MILFEWDDDKANSNLSKHGISFNEAKTVFYDDMAIQFYDDEHSVLEDRFIMLGLSSQLRLLVVVYCERDNANLIRIISARKATKNESKFYNR
jgi:uncharacterized DUF497 family protein